MFDFKNVELKKNKSYLYLKSLITKIISWSLVFTSSIYFHEMDIFHALGFVEKLNFFVYEKLDRLNLSSRERLLYLIVEPCLDLESLPCTHPTY